MKDFIIALGILGFGFIFWVVTLVISSMITVAIGTIAINIVIRWLT